jgi:hypothetical protein
MLKQKKIVLTDYDVEKTFIIQQMAAVPTLNLIKTALQIINDDSLTRKAVLLYRIHQALGTGTNVHGLTKEEMEDIALATTDDTICKVVNAALAGLTDDNLELVMRKCFESVTLQQGTMQMSGGKILQTGQIQDYLVIIVLLEEVIKLHLEGVPDRLKKLRCQASETVL